MDAKTMNQDYGAVEHDGKTCTLTTQAVADNYGTDGGVRYYADATDEAGNAYRIAWDTTEKWDLAQERARLEGESFLDDDEAERFAELQDMVLPDVNDESNACDWDRPVKVTPA